MVLLAALFGASPQANPEKLPDWIDPKFVRDLKGIAWIVTPSLVAALTILKFVRYRIGAPGLRRAVQVIVEEFRRAAFASRGGNEDDHRVTLFTARTKSWWKLPKWRKSVLLPVARSGHLTQSSKTSWPIGDENKNCLGVAGHAWASADGEYGVAGLPVIDASASESDFQEYAEGTFVPVDWCRSRCAAGKSFPRSMLAFQLRVGGERWGVVVLDSLDPTGIAERAKEWSRSFARILADLLQRKPS